MHSQCRTLTTSAIWETRMIHQSLTRKHDNWQQTIFVCNYYNYYAEIMCRGGSRGAEPAHAPLNCTHPHSNDK